MCGRYASSSEPGDLVKEFEVEEVASAVERSALEPNFNVAPTDRVYAVMQRKPRDPRRLTVLRWGLVPSWAKDPKIGSRMINARLESLADKSAFRKAFEVRRCLLPADGYYEWYTPAGAAGSKPRKQPFFIHSVDGAGLALAGLYEIWRDKRIDADDPAAFWWTCTVVTTAASDELRHIHDRMPVTIARADRGAWLDPSQTGADVLRAVAERGSAVTLEAYPVAERVNDVRNNGPQLSVAVPATGGEVRDG